MSKIFGIISSQFGRNSLKKHFMDMDHSFYFSDVMKHQVWHGNNASLGRLSNGAINCEKQPISLGNKYFVFTGHLLDYQSEKKELISTGSDIKFEKNDAEFLLNFIHKNGYKKLHHLNGIFVAALWDKQAQKLTIINDRYGMKPLYYYYSREMKTFVFASEIKPIIASAMADKTVNWEAWNIFLRLDNLIGEYTFFKNILRLPPASVLTFDVEGRLNLENYWRLDEIEITNNFNVKNIAESAFEVFRNAIRKYLLKVDNKIWLGLSGGHDTRWIASELASQNANFKAFTTRKFNTYMDDIALSKMVAKCLNIDHQIIDLPNDFVRRYDKMKNIMQDYESDENYYLIPMFEKVPIDHKFCFTGTADCIVNARYLNEYLLSLVQKGNYRLLAKMIIRKRGLGYLGPISSTIFKSERLKKFMEESVAIDIVEAELKKYKDFPDPITTFYFFNRIRRELALADSNIFIGKSEPFSPYLENDFFDFFMSLPPLMKLDRQILKSVFKIYLPKLSEIPVADLMEECQTQKYYDNSITIEEQLNNYCTYIINRIRHNQMPWLSNSFTLFLAGIYLSEKCTPMVSHLVNTLVNRSRRKYRFSRYFTTYSVTRMICMLNEWCEEYEIEVE